MFIEMEQEHQVQYGNSTINFKLSFSSRKTLGINVYPDKSVKVIAPSGAMLEKVRGKIEKKAAWIQKQIRKFSSIEKPVRIPEYVSGETFYYLGRQYRLKILKGESSLKLSGKFFFLNQEKKDNKRNAKKLLDNWYRQKAKEKLNERFEKYKFIIQREKIKFNKLLILPMEKRWGSCTQKGNIVLNTVLVQAPVDCIDYVIIHELCHLKHLNHSLKFYSLLKKYLPDWDRRKRKLEEF